MRAARRVSARADLGGRAKRARLGEAVELSWGWARRARRAGRWRAGCGCCNFRVTDKRQNTRFGIVVGPGVWCGSSEGWGRREAYWCFRRSILAFVEKHIGFVGKAYWASSSKSFRYCVEAYWLFGRRILIFSEKHICFFREAYSRPKRSVLRFCQKHIGSCKEADRLF